MKTELIETDELTSQLIITIDPEDYQDKFKAELREYGKKANLKGFRKGKTPISAVRKMFGRGVLAEVINKELEQAVVDYIKLQELEILGNPIPAEDQEMHDFDARELTSFEFKMDLGIAPKINTQGVEASDSYDQYVISYDEDSIDEEITQLRRRRGEQISSEGPIIEADLLVVDISEKHPPEGRHPWVGEISFLVKDLTDHYKDLLIGQVLNFNFDLDIYQLEKSTDEEFVKKHFLSTAPEDITAIFDADVLEISRVIPAELNEDFFEKTFDPKDNIKDLQSARELVRKKMDDYYESQAKAITQRRIMEALLEKNQVNFPDAFLKRWLRLSNENLKEEDLESEYEFFIKNITWILIKKEMSKKFDIDITYDMIKEGVKMDLQRQFQQYGYGMEEFDFDNAAERMMKKEETVNNKYRELEAELVLNHIMESVTLIENKITVQEAEAIIEQMN